MATHSIMCVRFQALADDDANTNAKNRILTFPKHVSPDKDLRDASVTAGKALAEFHVEMR